MDHIKIRPNLSAYKDGELDWGFERPGFSRHLQAGDACREELRALDQIDSPVRGLPGLAVPETSTN